MSSALILLRVMPAITTDTCPRKPRQSIVPIFQLAATLFLLKQVSFSTEEQIFYILLPMVAQAKMFRVFSTKPMIFTSFLLNFSQYHPLDDKWTFFYTLQWEYVFVPKDL